MAGEKVQQPSLLPHEEEEKEEEEDEEVVVERDEAKERSSSLTPWEQHSSVIILPRYDYAAASSLLRRSHSGFLITCPIKREKSATKEAISLLEEVKQKKCQVPCLVRQETCLLLEKELEVVVSKLFREFLGDDEEKLNEPIKFAVGYNRRGVDETEMKTLKDTEGSKKFTLMDRDQCFRVVAGAVKTVAKNSIVDLKSPEVAVLVELLPLSGIPHGSSVVGVSVLPAELVSTKPRLCMKSLVANTKATKRGR